MQKLGTMIDQLKKLDQHIADKNAEISKLKSEREEHAAKIIEVMSEQGLQKSSGKLATASITEKIEPSVTDWDAVHRFISRNKLYHLYYRRLNGLPYRELLDARNGKGIPGVDSYTKVSLSLRKL